MIGRYIRQKRDGLRDPTMTHVEDPSVFHVGDCVRSYEGWQIITAIDESPFGNPDTRFVHLEPFGDATDDAMLGSQGWHDLRPYDVENFHQSAWTLEGKPLSGIVSLDEARQIYEDALRDHTNGFIG